MTNRSENVTRDDDDDDDEEEKILVVVENPAEKELYSASPERRDLIIFEFEEDAKMHVHCSSHHARHTQYS